MAGAGVRAGACGTARLKPRCSNMMRVHELTARAEHYDHWANSVMDPVLALALRQRARQWRDLAVEVSAFQRDPAYRAIHDGPVPAGE